MTDHTREARVRKAFIELHGDGFNLLWADSGFANPLTQFAYQLFRDGWTAALSGRPADDGAREEAERDKADAARFRWMAARMYHVAKYHYRLAVEFPNTSFVMPFDSVAQAVDREIAAARAEGGK